MKYLLKIEAMLGDADGYQNGLMVIDEKQYAFFEKNKDREMTWGNREFMWGRINA